MLGLLSKAGVRGGIDTFHLVEDNALVLPGPVRAVGLDMPSFLTEAVFRNEGMEDGVHIDVDEVVEILQIGAGHGIAGLVRESEGVEKGLQRALEEVHEGFLDRIFARAAENRVLDDVRHAGGVFGRCAEGCAEAFVFVIIDDGENLRARDVVLPEAGRAADFRHIFFFNEGKTCMIHRKGPFHISKKRFFALKDKG